MLIDLIVVVFLISLLAIACTPTLEPMTDRTDAQVCLDHLRQLVAGLDGYCADNDGFLPLALTRHSTWMDQLDPYTGTTRKQRMRYDISTPYHCPTALAVHPGFTRSNGNTYGINGFTVGRQEYIPEAEDWLELDVVRQFKKAGLEAPDQCMVFGDGHWNDGPSNTIRKITTGSWTYMIDSHAWSFPERIHGGGAQFVFFDGHVEDRTDIPLEIKDPFWWPVGNRK